MASTGENPSELDLSDCSDALEQPSLTESELQKIYEDGEIRRFLHLFASYVSEVKSKDRPTHSPTENGQPEVPLPVDESLSQYIAQHIVEPRLPTDAFVAPPFTLGRLRLTFQRLYLGAETAYLPFLKSTFDLARWKNFKLSAFCCSIFWILWWNNFVLPSILLWVLAYSVHKRLRPYPTGQELQNYHSQLEKADHLGNQFSQRVFSSSVLDVREGWRLLRLTNKTINIQFRSKKAKSPKDQRASGSKHQEEEGTADAEDLPDSESAGPPEELDEYDAELGDFKRVALYYLTCLADFHERFQNIFLWRNPAASRRYIMGIATVFLCTTFIPTALLAKMVWLLLGILFWHITPIVDSLSPGALNRIPPLLEDVPTDAEYAMQLISRRVASGEDILPPGSPLDSRFQRLNRSIEVKAKQHMPSRSVGGELGKMMSNEARRIQKVASDTGVSKGLKNHLPPVLANVVAMALPDLESDVRTYACQSGSTMGQISLTAKHIYFTPFLSGTSTMEIAVESISGVKKIGLLKGLQLSWITPEDGSKSEDLKFSWVTNRDDLFTRLIGLGKQRWKSV